MDTTLSVSRTNSVSVMNNQLNDQPESPAPRSHWKFSIGLIGGAGLGIVFGGAAQNPGLGLLVGSGVGIVVGFVWSSTAGRNAS